MSSPFRIATGHQLTTQAAAEILGQGGTAVDAALAAVLSACVAEPMLASLGGGGHALIEADNNPPVCLDFFAQTPRQKHPGPLDFYPIEGNFGTATQEFHVGMASIATPGVVAGLDALHQRYGTVPKKRLIEPAQRAARAGVALNALQHHTLQILEPIVRATPEASQWAGINPPEAPLPEVGSVLAQPQLAEFLDQWAQEGGRCFYQGPLAEQLVADSQHRGGHLSAQDLAEYQVQWRTPLQWSYRQATIWSNPPPAFGGMMLALSTLGLARHLPADARLGSVAHLEALVKTMAQVNDDRRTLETAELSHDERALQHRFEALLTQHAQSRRGTTHISIDDGHGMAVSMTISNGEGSGYVLEPAGIMLNNMLGEEDINRNGFHHWPENVRLSSMMTPTIIHDQAANERHLLGSGGSNRIRTALLQVVSHLFDFGLDLESAIAAPRAHLEGDHLSVELADQWSPEARQWLSAAPFTTTLWPRRSLFFGGVHATGPTQACADARREGASIAGQTHKTAPPL